MGKLVRVGVYFAIVVVSFLASGWLTLTVSWHAAGLDQLGRDDADVAAGAMGGFAEFVQAVMAGTVAAVVTAAGLAVWDRRRRRRQFLD